MTEFILPGGGMKISDDGNWLEGARRVLSPNCDDRPEGVFLSLIVVHGISVPPGEYGGPWIDELFTNRLDSGEHPYFREIAPLRVSSHLLIRRTGETVQYVPFHRRAWHAGQSCYRGCEACNDFSIGVELEGQDEEPYEEAQYHQLAVVIRLLRRHFPHIGRQDIAGHCDIAPGRKTDPGPAFNWQKLHSLL